MDDESKIIFPGPDPSQTRQEFLDRRKNSYTLWVISGVIGLLFTIVIGLIIVGANLLVSSANNFNLRPQTVKPPEEQAVTSLKKSRFATDSAVLKLRGDILKIRTDIDSVDLFETQITPPNIDLNISIQPVN